MNQLNASIEQVKITIHAKGAIETAASGVNGNMDKKMKFKLYATLIITMLLFGLLYGVVFHLIVMPLFGDELLHCIGMGLILGFIYHIAFVLIYKKFDILRNTVKNLEKKIYIDKLTGLYNRRAFDMITKEINDYQTYSIIFIDIDDFRKFNNQFGHAIGDIVLQKASSTIMMHVRSIDRAFRYGGEEFIVILMGCDKKKAAEIANIIRVNVENIDNIPYHSITISLGVASYPEDSLRFEKILKASDEALINAKRSGKNCTIEYSKSM